MTRHFTPTVSERKYRRRQQRKHPSSPPKKEAEMSVWVFQLQPKPTDTSQTYILSLKQSIDPNLFHEEINRIIPDTKVSVDDPQSLQSFFIIELYEPLTLREIYSKTKQALKGMI